MGAIKYAEFDYVFDDVQFAIDVRAARTRLEMTQQQVADRVGYETATTVSAIENARYDQYFSVQKFLAFCKVFDLHPFDYFDMQRQLDKE